MFVGLQGKQVSKASLLQNLVRNTNINLAGIGITLIGLQASGGCVLEVESRSKAGSLTYGLLTAALHGVRPDQLLMIRSALPGLDACSNMWGTRGTDMHAVWSACVLCAVLCFQSARWSPRPCWQLPTRPMLRPHLEAHWCPWTCSPCRYILKGPFSRTVIHVPVPSIVPIGGPPHVFCCVAALQASTNTLLAHFLSVVFANCIIGVLSKARGRPAAA